MMKKMVGNTLIIALLLLHTACGQNNNTTTSPQYGSVLVEMQINGNPALHATADSPKNQSILVSAKIMTRSLQMPDGGLLEKNTLIVGATVVIDAASAKVKTLNLSIPNITEPGTYNLVEKGGMFVYSDASGGIAHRVGYMIAEVEEGSCSVTITDIGGEPIPTAGKVVKGTFTATIEEDGTTYTLKGSFNGGIEE